MRRLVFAAALALVLATQALPAGAAYSWRTYPGTETKSYLHSLYVRHAQNLVFRLSYRKTAGRACTADIMVNRRGYLPEIVDVKPLYSGAIIRTGTYGLRSGQAGGASITFFVTTNTHCWTRLSVRL